MCIKKPPFVQFPESKEGFRKNTVLWIGLFHDGHLINQVLRPAQFVDDEQDVADVHADATLLFIVETDVAAQRFPVAVESAADEVAFAVDDGRA